MAYLGLLVSPPMIITTTFYNLQFYLIMSIEYKSKWKVKSANNKQYYVGEDFEKGRGVRRRQNLPAALTDVYTQQDFRISPKTITRRCLSPRTRHLQIVSQLQIYENNAAGTVVINNETLTRKMNSITVFNFI